MHIFIPLVDPVEMLIANYAHLLAYAFIHAVLYWISHISIAMHLRHLPLLNLYVCWFNSLQLTDLANGASELARAYIRRARESVRTGMLIFNFQILHVLNLLLRIVKISFRNGYRKVKSRMHIFSMMHVLAL
jgi:hypothetical protein